MTTPIPSWAQNNLLQDRIYQYCDKFELIDDPKSKKHGTKSASFIIIRFNLYFENLRKLSNIETKCEYEKWLTFRSNFFLKFVIDTLIGQFDRTFRVLLYVDNESNEIVENLINEISIHDWITPVRFDNRGKYAAFEFEDSVLHQASPFLTSDVDAISTTRLDSDDLLSVAYMLNMRQYISYVNHDYLERNTICLNFPIGLQMSNGNCSLAIYKRNPFQTLLVSKEKFLNIEKWARRSIMQCAHDRTDKLFEVIDVMTLQPSWAQVVHGGNALNRTRENHVRCIVDKTVDKIFAGVPSRLMSVLG